MSTPGDRMRQFYNSKGIAILGMSHSKKNFPWMIYDGLLKSGAKAYAVHPKGGNHRNVEFHQSCASLPEDVDAAVIGFEIKKSPRDLEELKNKGIEKIWLQQGSYDDSVLNKARQMGFDVYTGCALMYLPNTGFPHRLHRFFHELFSKG